MCISGFFSGFFHSRRLPLPVAPVHILNEDERERDLYESNPLAFWLRPDRHNHDCMCWEIDEPYVPGFRIVSVIVTNAGSWYSHQHKFAFSKEGELR